MKQFIAKLLTISIIPLMMLTGIIALFQTNTHYNNQHAYRIVQITGHWPIYAAYSHAFMSQRLILIAGVIMTAILLVFRGIRHGGPMSDALIAWMTAFFAYVTLAWLQWIRLHPSLHHPFYPGAIRAVEFATLAAIIAAAGGVILIQRMKK